MIIANKATLTKEAKIIFIELYQDLIWESQNDKRTCSSQRIATPTKFLE